MTDFDDTHDHDDEDLDPVEAYCVRCRDTVEMEDPQPVWTRKGTPGTRGFCPVCGTTVFRMGRTDAHAALKKPSAVRVAVADGEGKHPASRPARAVAATYIAHAAADAPFAHRLASDLNNMGIPTWLPRAENGDIAWAGGVHPALEDCRRLLVILSGALLDDAAARAAWTYFRAHRKPIVVAQVASAAVPDDLRRAPRVDFGGVGIGADYRHALRALVQTLAE